MPEGGAPQGRRLRLQIAFDRAIRAETTPLSGGSQPSGCEDAVGGPLAIELFRLAASERKDATALEGSGRRLTFRELNQKTELLAGRLRSLGAMPETRIAICLERTVDFAVAILGVLKAGAAWVPLDPAFPPPRVRAIFREARPDLLITEPELENLFPDAVIPVVRVDEDRPEAQAAGHMSSDRPQPAATDAAYLMFTSGSTGEPKGVVLTHGGLSSYVREIGAALGIRPSDGYLHTASMGFSSSVRQLLVPLVHGARVVLASAEEIRDPALLFGQFERRGVSIIDVVPSYWRAAMDALQSVIPEGSAFLPRHPLRLVLSASEPLSADLVRRWRSRFGRSDPVVNMYGQTETTGIVTLYPVPTHLDGEPNVLPIGRSIGHTRVAILDAARHRSPTGVEGEIWVAGPRLARGYLHRDAETASVFLPNVLGRDVGPRMYRTGDFGCERADGTIEYRGRQDDQVKIRGVRIELDEVSRALGCHPDVRECAVVSRENASGVRQLVAFVSAFAGSVVDAAALRSHLAGLLPEPMVPSNFTFLKGLPRTPTGKLDRFALRSLTTSERSASPCPPRDARERALAEIWANVLGVAHPGMDDDFFELGGDSISAFRVVARAHAQGIRVTTGQLITHPTIAGLASVATATATATATGQPGPDSEAAFGPLDPTPMACWLWERGTEVLDRYRQAVILETRPGVDASDVRVAFEALLEHHDALRIRWATSSRGFRAWIAPPRTESATEVFEHKIVPPLAEPAREAASLLQELEPAAAGAPGSISATAEIVQTSVRLSRGRIAKAAYFESPGQTGRLFLGLHHLAVDGVSWRILLEDLNTAYEQVRRGEAVRLPEKTMSFRQWSRRVTAAAGSPEITGDVEHWEGLSAITLPALRRDGPSPNANTMVSTRTASVELTREETEGLLRRCPRVHGADVEELLLVALARTFESWNGTSSLFVNVEGHGRDVLGGDVDTSRTVGWFTIHWPLFLEFSGARSATELVGRIRDQYREGRSRRASFFLLRYLGDLETRQSLSRLPQPEVRLNYLGGFDGIFPGNSAFRLTRDSPGPSSSPEGTRCNVFDVFGSILERRLRFDWGFSVNLHRRSTVEMLAEKFAAELRELIAASPEAAIAEREALDLPLASLAPVPVSRLLDRSGKGRPS